MEDKEIKDFWFISDDIRKGMLNICNDKLINSVYDDFRKIGVISERNSDQKPKQVWSLTNYLNLESKSSLSDKIEVSLAFLWNKGIIIYNEKPYDTVMDFLSILKNENFISDEELASYVDKFFNLAKNNSPEIKK